MAANTEVDSNAGAKATPAATPLEAKKTRSEIYKNWFEVGALTIAGVWALCTFLLKECPNREPHFDVTNNLEWSTSQPNDRCKADWTLSLKNISTRDIDIDHVDVYAWTFRPLFPQSGRPTYLNLDELRPKDIKDPAVLFAKTFTKEDGAPLTGEYATNSADSHTFEWVFQRPAAETWIAFELEAFDKRSNAKRLTYVYEWSQVCPPRKPPDCCDHPPADAGDKKSK